MALDYLPSPGWAVIYGETPSATRWSELGDNDDALATGAGIDDLAILTRHLAAGAATDDKWRNGVAFRAYKNAAQSVAAGTFTKMILQTEEWDLGNNFDAGANSRFVAPVNGIYHFSGGAGISNDTTRVIGTLYRNGVEYTRGSNNTGTDANRSLTASDIKLNAGDYVELWGWRPTAGNIQAEATHGAFLSGHLVTRT